MGKSFFSQNFALLYDSRGFFDEDGEGGALAGILATSPDAFTLTDKRALSIKPRYARGWLNMGIANSHVGDYAEAARCYLAALSLNPRAEHIWVYLRIALSCLGKYELAAMAERREIAPLSAEFGSPDF